MKKSTGQLYNENADKWVRREPNSLSDFTARPRVFALCGDVTGKAIVDLGAGEGYCARVLAAQGAGAIQGIELSEEMVSLAAKQSSDDDRISYQQGNVVDLPYEDSCFDLALGVFVYNYLTVKEIQASFSEVFRVLKDNGEFIFSVPHPAFPFIKSSLTAPFYFDTQGMGYFSSRDHQCQGEIFCKDGSSLAVQMIPKLMEDYLAALKLAGFNSMPEIQEYGVTDEMIALDESFFSPLKDIPLHMAFKITK